MKLVLLPGMDGTGELFASFVEALPKSFKPVIVRYPTERFLSYLELEELVRAACPASEPFMLVAESFSTPVAITLAAKKPPNLRGLILCAGFSSSPLRGWQRSLASLLAPILFHMYPPDWAVRLLLVGSDAPTSLLRALRRSLASVQPSVLAARLRTSLACDVSEELSRIGMPILYIQATRDRMLGPRCLEEIRKIKPQVTVTALDSPHLLLQREPRRAVEIIGGWANSQAILS